VPSDLLLAASGWPSPTLAQVVPPSCAREVTAAPSFAVDGNDLVATFPEFRPRQPAHRLIPALSALGDSPRGFRFELSAFAHGSWSPWVAGATIGDARFASLASSAEALVCEVDEFIANPPAERVRVVLRARADGAEAAPTRWCASLSAWSPGSDETPGVDGTRLSVPALSQMEEDPALRHRVCSPTCVAMVMAYYGTSVPVAELAREMLQPELDLYGVWPAAIRAASRRGIGGYLLRFPDWAAAAWCLERGMPVIASVRYGAGELSGAAIEQTTGHLVVLTGCAGGEVFVNDPAAPRSAEVARRYRLDELRRVWLGRSGVGYVLFAPAPRPGGARETAAA
jgi:peptidase C39-like protein